MKHGSHFDVAIIGAGMSGLGAGIRLAHFGKRVCILERHSVPGGLNSFYSIDGRKYDVGLHAVTNYVRPEVKGTPLARLLRQLRIEREELDLCPQLQSRVVFGSGGEIALRFTNDSAVLEAEIAEKFPAQRDGFRRLAGMLGSYDELSMPTPPASAREIVRRHITDPLLEDMLFCPLMYYGSAREHDMDFAQFGIMFRSIYLEGLARPFAGVRRIIRVLLAKYRAAGGERRMNCGVARIVEQDGRAAELVMDDGSVITAEQVISSIGSAETMRLLDPQRAAAPSGRDAAPEEPRLSFVESIRVMNSAPAALGWGSDTIVFFNDGPRFAYARPAEQVDLRSGVICFPNNFDYGGRQLPEGLVRITCLANYDQWAALPEERYRADKQRWTEAMTRSAGRFLPPVAEETLTAATVTTDTFTPRTITRYTGHLGGAVYGAPRKIRDGTTRLRNLYLCGTDQGLLGIVGTLLSGISMANRHILQADMRGRMSG
jgi:phytoene dehydrogenase-like protein